MKGRREVGVGGVGGMLLRTKRATVQTQRAAHRGPCGGWARGWIEKPVVTGKVPGAASQSLPGRDGGEEMACRN